MGDCFTESWLVVKNAFSPWKGAPVMNRKSSSETHKNLKKSK